MRRLGIACRLMVTLFRLTERDAAFLLKAADSLANNQG